MAVYVIYFWEAKVALNLPPSCHHRRKMASFREPPVPENRGGNATDDDAIRSTNDDAAVSKLWVLRNATLVMPF